MFEGEETRETGRLIFLRIIIREVVAFITPKKRKKMLLGAENEEQKTTLGRFSIFYFAQWFRRQKTKNVLGK